jgi:hypothetical protein
LPLLSLSFWLLLCAPRRHGATSTAAPLGRMMNYNTSTTIYRWHHVIERRYTQTLRVLGSQKQATPTAPVRFQVRALACGTKSIKDSATQLNCIRL